MSKTTTKSKIMIVRYGKNAGLGFFEHNEPSIPKLQKRVVVKSNRGLELGTIVGSLSPYKSGQFKFSPEQIQDYFDASEIDQTCEIAGKFVRYATEEDISEQQHLGKIAEEEAQTCKKFAEELGLSIKVVMAEHIFGGERIIFYFMAEGRVDFRELVKKLAKEYQTRIEMRQVGSRDEAKLLGDVETCGQECCCIRFLQTLKPVNMRMAKMQKATLDPSKISGYCGRLKCCLRYEDKTYTQLKKNLPKKNTHVKTNYGIGRVIDTQILTQLVMIELENNEKISVGVEEIEILPQQTNSKNKQKKEENKKQKQEKNNES